MACIKAENGTKVFAIFNICFVGLWTVLSIGLLLFLAVSCFFYGCPHISNLRELFVQLGISISSTAFALMTLVFSVFLLSGSLKKNPRHMKAYCVYGVIFIVISTVVLVTACVQMSDYSNFSVHVAVLVTVIVIIFVIYGLILFMIRHTYIKLEIAINQYGSNPLLENGSSPQTTRVHSV